MTTRVFCLVGLAGMLMSSLAWGAPVEVQLLHTNDLHSRMRSQNSVQGLGGVARIATAVRQARETNPHTLLVDAGDWSEGGIYYTLGAGRATLELMEQITYDVALVGNHDWLNGPDTLLQMIRAANPQRVSIIGANFGTNGYANAAAFREKVLPYAIREVGGIKVAFIGLLTYEFIFDKYARPLSIVDPFKAARDLAAELRPKVDLVVGVSHNGLSLSKNILLAAPEMDFIIGGHDHVLLREPLLVPRPNAPPSFIVEAGCWGRWLGQVRLRVTPRAEQPTGRNFELLDYQVRQMDARIPADPAVEAKVADYEAQISSAMGQAVFTETIADNHLHISREGIESPMGDLVTDAFRELTGADIALDQNRLIYNELFPGPLTRADAFNILPAVWNPDTQRTWNVRKLPMTGRTLLWLLRLVYSYGKIAQFGSLSTSGMEVVFNPALFREKDSLRAFLGTDLMGAIYAIGAPDPASPPDFIQNVKIGGEPLDTSRTYAVALGGGLVEAVAFINSFLPNAIPTAGIRDTGLEGWRVLADFLARKRTIDVDSFVWGSRMRTLQPNLVITPDQIDWSPARRAGGEAIASVAVTVQNRGVTPAAAGAQLHLQLNDNGIDWARPLAMRDMVMAKELPAIAPGEAVTIRWEDVRVPILTGDLASITAVADPVKSEFDVESNTATRWFTVPVFPVPAPAPTPPPAP